MSEVEKRRWDPKVDDVALARLFKSKKLDATKIHRDDVRAALKHFPHCECANFAPLYKGKCKKWKVEKDLAAKRRGPSKWLVICSALCSFV